MTTTSTSVRTRAIAAIVSLLLLIGAQVLGVVPRAMAATPGTISGTVVDAVSGLPLAGVVISTVGEASVSTGPTGAYTLSVTAGDHAVTASLAGYAPKTSAQLTVGEGAAVTGINFSLQQYASVTGVVTDAGGSGVGGVVVKLFDATTTDVNPVKQVTLPGSGMFELTDVVPGSYKVEYDAQGVSYMTRWYTLASTRDQATVVTLAPGATLDLSQTLVKASSVSGNVVDAGGIGIPNAQVTLVQNGAAIAQVTTSATGAYVIGSITGADQYTVQVHASGYVTTWYGNVPGAANAVHFSLADSAAVTLNDISLPRGGSISGHMTPGDVSFSYVVASAPGVGTYSAPVDTATGSYTIGDLPSGLYAVGFNANGYYPLTVPNVSVTGEQAVTGIDATLSPAGPVGSGYDCSVTGKVVYLAGQPLPGVTVYSASTRFTTTSADGSYTLGILSIDGSITYGLDGYVRETRGAYCVDAGGTVALDDVHLSRVVTITGVVTDGGLPVVGAIVTAYAAPSTGSSATLTASDGTYTITNLPEGNYAVSASATGDPETFFGGGGSLATASYYAMGEGSTTVNVNLALYKAGSISGTVSMSDGSSTLGAQVTAWSADFSKTVLAGPGGTFTVGELPAGAYTLSAYLITWASISQSVDVHQGEAVSGTQLELGNGVAVSGIVSRAGTAIPGLTVTLRASGGQTDSVVADSNGAYVFRGVPQGTYTVGTALGSDTYWLGGVTNPAHAQTFTVTTDPVTNADIKIPTTFSATVTVLLPGGDVGRATTGTVDAYDAYGDHAGAAGIDPTGLAALSLTPGTYALKVAVPGYPTATGSVTVVDGTAAATLTLSQGAHLALAVDAGSTAVSVVAAVREMTTGIASSVANPLDGLAAGTYVVAYYPLGTGGSYCGPLAWYGGSSYQTATPVTLAEGQSKELTVHATCAPTAASDTLTGSIQPPAGVTLTAGSVAVTLTDLAGSHGDSTVSDADGHFTFLGVPPGSYSISASDTSGILVDTAVEAQVTTGAVDVAVPMVVGGRISGRVVDAFGHEVAAVVNLVGGSVSLGRNTSTGQFALTGLPTGDYTLTIVPTAPYTAVELTPVHVTLGGTTDVGTVAAQLGGRITGHVPLVDGAAVLLTVDVVDGGGRVLATTSVTGGNDYALWGVPAGTAYVRFSGAGLVTTWWQAGTSLATATAVQVMPNGVVSGVDPTPTAVVVPTTTISGTVSGSAGAMSGVSVTASADAGGSATATTGADGTYTMTVPVNATYTVGAAFCMGDTGELGCYGQLVTTTTTVTVGTTPASHVDLTFGASDAPFVQAPVPTIAGDPIAGSTLTATLGTWSPAPDGTQLQWLGGGAPIVGATGTTLAVTPDLVGSQISVRVTATKSGYVTTTTTSVSTPAVQAGEVTGTVLVAGSGTVGSALTATATWTPDLVTDTAYTWQRNGIDVGTGATYVVAPGDVGQTLTVTATAATSVPGYTVTPATATVPVVAGAISGSVSITGSAVVGQTLTATGSWTPSDAAATYTWLRDAATAATGTTYTVSTADEGHVIAVWASVTATGYTATTVTSGSVSVPLVAGAVTLPGATVGAVVTPSLSGWPDVTPTLEWSINGRTATGATYTPVASDSGKTLTVVVTASRTGFTTVRATATTLVQDATMAAGTVAIDPAPKVGATSVAVLSGWATDATYAYSWTVGGTEVSTLASYTPTPSDAGKQLTLRVTATKQGYGSATSSASASVGLATITGGTASIAGTVAVGSTLTASSDGWSPATVTVTYAWARDGQPVATGATYVPTLSDVGHALTVTATATATGYTSATVSSAPTGLVPPVAMTAGVVTISGTAAVGSTLTANAGTWSPAGVAFAYQWLRDGVAITGATAQTYAATPTDVGTRLSVRVTGSKAGYTSASAVSASTAPVQRATVVAGAVTISGSAGVGSTLTAQPGTWSPNGVRLSYQWLRDGVVIRGATDQRYTVLVVDVGHQLSVSVTGSRFPYGSATAVSAPTATVQQPRVVAGTVTITGSPTVGTRLHAHHGSWTPGDVSLAFQWLRDGVAIAGATDSRYTVGMADVGHALSVSVTGTRTGFVPATATSAATAEVPPAVVLAGTVAINGRAVQGSYLLARTSGWSPNVSLSYQWLRDGVAIPAARRLYYQLTAEDVDHVLTVTVTGSQPGYESTTVTSGPTATVR